VSTPRELLDRIKVRTWVLVIAGGGDISWAEAQRAAASEVRAQERARKRSAAVQSSAAAPSMEGVTPANARQWLTNKLAEIAERLKAAVDIVDTPSPQVRKHVDDPEGTRRRLPPAPAPVAKQAEPDPPEHQVIGGIYGTTTATAERIDPSEYANSLRWGDRATDNWRRSIETNERIAREKQMRSRYIG
jgi:hypothetical protein